MKLYPIMLIVQDQKVVVVGSGAVAVRKVNSLLDAGAKVTVVTEDLPRDAKLDGVEVIHARYSSEHLAGAKLVYACTNDPQANAKIADDARREGAIVNCADQPEDCDFYVPAIVSDGDVIVAIGTGGASPALAGRLKNCIANALPQRIGEFSAALLRVRDLVKARVDDLDRRGEILKTLSNESSYQVFIAGGEQSLVKLLDEMV